MILSRDDLLIAEHKGNIGFDTRKPFSAFSLDIRLGKLYRHLRSTQPIVLSPETIEKTQEEFIETELEEIALTESGHLLEKGTRYFWEPYEKISLQEGYCAEIVSRSSAARQGICSRSKSIDDSLHISQLPFEGYPLSTVRTFREGIRLFAKQSFAQLIIMKFDKYELIEQELQLFESGQLELTRQGIPLLEEDLEVQGHIVLTMDPLIKVYSDGIFRDLRLDKDNVTYLRQGTFFISSSAEKVSIPPTHVGYVTDRASWKTNQLYFHTKDPQYAPLPFISHPNAPYIGPRPIFEATITFENFMVEGGYLKPGMKQSELCLKPLVTPLEHYTEQSRYHNQQGATLSKKK